MASKNIYFHRLFASENTAKLIIKKPLQKVKVSQFFVAKSNFDSTKPVNNFSLFDRLKIHWYYFISLTTVPDCLFSDEKSFSIIVSILLPSSGHLFFSVSTDFSTIN